MNYSYHESESGSKSLTATIVRQKQYILINSRKKIISTVLICKDTITLEIKDLF